MGTPDPDGGWRAAVDLTWRFEGFDAEPVHEEVLVSFASGSGDAVGITAFGGGDRRSPLWLSGPLEVRRSAETLVLATSAAEADLLAERAAAAVPVVRAVLPDWSARLVVEAPASEADLAAALAAEPGTYDDIAAVTASVDGSLTSDAQVHVFVNPEVYDDLDPAGGQVVLSHEATHAATDAPLTGGVPLWLLEGFADYVALRDVDLPLSTTAGQVIAQVKADGPPDQLPGEAEFDATDSHLGAAYESAWLACVELADAGGEPALVQLYEQVSRGRDLDERLQAPVRLRRGGADRALAAAARGPRRDHHGRGVSVRRVALWATLAGAAVFVVLAVLLVPWDPVPGGPLRPAPASEVFTAAEIQRAQDYADPQRLLSWASLAVSLVAACVLGFTGLGARLVDRVRGPWWWQVVAAVLALALVGRVLTLPFSVLLRRRALEYGLSTQAWGAYAVDLVKGLGVDVVATSIALVVLVGVARRWPRAWPAVAGTVLAGLVLLGSFVYPLLVEPLFNEFEPLPDGDLRTQILALADEEGVQVGDVLVADASRRTTTLNAYVSGFGSSRRVVVYDNLVDQEDQPVVLSVVAHELAHARHDDVLTGSLLGAAGALLGVGLLALLAGGVGDPRRVPRVLALVAVATLLASPVQNGISRQIETRADVDALRTTDDPASFIELQKQLARKSLADPTPPAFSQFWFGSHPTGLQRIALAERLDALTGSTMTPTGGTRGQRRGSSRAHPRCHPARTGTTRARGTSRRRCDRSRRAVRTASMRRTWSAAEPPRPTAIRVRTIIQSSEAVNGASTAKARSTTPRTPGGTRLPPARLSARGPRLRRPSRSGSRLPIVDR